MARSAPPPYLVIGVGGDSESLPAAQWSVREAEARNLQVVVAHGASIPYGDPQLLSGVVDAIVAEAEAVVARAMSHLTIPPGLAVRTVVEPLPAVALLRRLAENAEFVALGRDHLTTFRRITQGAVTATDLRSRAVSGRCRACGCEADFASAGRRCPRRHDGRCVGVTRRLRGGRPLASASDRAPRPTGRRHGEGGCGASGEHRGDPCGLEGRPAGCGRALSSREW